MYYAKGIKDLLSEVEITLEFFQLLDDFTLAYVDSFFKQCIEENMGLLTEVQYFNYECYLDYLNLNGLDLPEHKLDIAS